MELKVNAIAVPDPISFNYDELKEGLLKKAEVYSAMVYTEDQITAAKADRANLNRLKKALNDERIKREKEYMQPFTDFKAKINEIIKIIDKPVAAIDSQIKGYEEQQRQEKMDRITEFWNSCEDVPGEIHLGQIMDERWLNASVSMKSIKEAITAKIEQINKELRLVRHMPEFAFEAEQVYLSTLDMGEALSEANRLQETARKKAALEAERAKATQTIEKVAEEAARLGTADYGSVIEAANTLAGTMQEQQTSPLANLACEWISFKALLSVEDATALKEFFRSRGIEYEAI